MEEDVMTLSGQNASSQLTAPKPGAQPIHCVRCGYDLRGTDSNGRCPECGLKAYWSLRAPEQLSQYPAGWVASMAWGVRLLGLVYGSTFLIFMLAMTRLVRIDRTSHGDSHGMGWIGFLLIAWMLLHPIGAWALARYSGHWTEPRARWNRMLLRIAPFFIALVLAEAVASFWFPHPAIERWLPVLVFVGLIAPAAVFIRLRSVARMITDARLAERGLLVGYGFAVTVILYAIFLVWMQNAPLAAQLPLWGQQYVGLSLAVALLLFLILGAMVLTRCMIDFGRAAKVARAQWRSDAARE
jgi:hypothetical protein